MNSELIIQLTYLSHFWQIKSFDEDLWNGMILIDFQKVFNTIDHEVRFKKPKAMGFSEGCIA